MLVAQAVLAARAGLGARRGAARVGSALIAAPAVLAMVAAGTAVAVLLGSFLAAPVRRPAGSLAVANLHQLTGGPDCGLADDIQVLPDGAVLVRADSSGQLTGFTALTGFDPDSPPPDSPGGGRSVELWGSLVGGARSTGTMISPWFTLPAPSPASGLAVSVSGRTDGGSQLVLEFGRAEDAGVTALGDRAPFDWVPLTRTIWTVRWTTGHGGPSGSMRSRSRPPPTGSGSARWTPPATRTVGWPSPDPAAAPWSG